MRTAAPLTSALARSGFAHAVNSFAFPSPEFVHTGPRRYGLLLASRFPIEPIAPGRFEIPWPERVLSARIFVPGKTVEVHTTHIPPGSSNGWIKIAMLQGLYGGLARPSAVPCILCGDFNAPQAERPDGVVVTWAERIRRNGTIARCATVRGGPGAAWDAAERSILLGLQPHDLADVFRAIHGYGIRV